MDKEPAKKERKPIQVLRERCGGMTDELKAYYREQQSARKQLRALLVGVGATIPQLAAATGYDSAFITWQVMALRKYGQVVEAGRDGDYLRYALKEVPNGR